MCAYHCVHCRTQHSRAVLNFSVIIQTIIIAQMMSTGREGRWIQLFQGSRHTLHLIENMCSSCSSSIKWDDIWSDMFRVDFGVRHGSVLSPYLFAFVCRLHLYITNLVLWLQQADKFYLLTYCTVTVCNVSFWLCYEARWADLSLKSRPEFETVNSCQLIACQILGAKVVGSTRDESFFYFFCRFLK